MLALSVAVWAQGIVTSVGGRARISSGGEARTEASEEDEEDNNNIHNRPAAAAVSSVENNNEEGLLLQSRYQNHRRLETPHLQVKYRAPTESHHARA